MKKKHFLLFVGFHLVLFFAVALLMLCAFKTDWVELKKVTLDHASSPEHLVTAYNLSVDLNRKMWDLVFWIGAAWMGHIVVSLGVIVGIQRRQGSKAATL